MVFLFFVILFFLIFGNLNALFLCFFFDSSAKGVNRNKYQFFYKEKKRITQSNFLTLLNELKTILSYCLHTKEYYYAAGVAIILALKTINDVWLINNGTEIEAAIINSNLKNLKKNLGSFFLAMPTLVVTNNLLKYFLNQLRLNLRYNLSKHFYHKYMESSTLYFINALKTDCPNLDQLLTNDVEKFCNTLLDVYSNTSKPVLDIITLVYRLSANYTGFKTSATMIGYLLLTASVLIKARKPLARLIVKETQLEGQLRYIHSRLITNCEEITFYQGNDREKVTLMNVLNCLKLHLHEVALLKFNLDFLENLITKCKATF